MFSSFCWLDLDTELLGRHERGALDGAQHLSLGIGGGADY